MRVSKMRVSKEKAITVPFIFVTWLSGFVSEETSKMILLAMIFTTFRMLFLYKKVQIVFVFYIFHLTYILILIPYFWYGIPITGHSVFQIPLYMNQTLLVHGLFVFVLYIFSDLNLPNRSIIFSKHLPKWDNPVLFLVLTIIMVAILTVMTINKTNIFGMGSDQIWNSYNGNLGGSGLPEYFPVFFLVAFIFAKNRNLKRVLVIIYIVFAYLAITRGMRVTLLLTTLLFFALFFDGKFKTRYVILVAILGMVLVQAAGFARDGKTQIDDLFTIYGGSTILTNQSEVFYTSNVMLSIVTDGITGIGERLYSLFAASLQVLLPPRFVLSEGKPIYYVANWAHRAVGGGGLISVFFYFWMSYPGVFLIARFLALGTNKAIKKPSFLFAIYIVCVYSFYPRWLAYDAINFLFRLPLYAVIMYLLLVDVHRLWLRQISDNVSKLKTANE
jgi:hypothetical protein